jgi:hypothetical protein
LNGNEKFYRTGLRIREKVVLKRVGESESAITLPASLEDIIAPGACTTKLFMIVINSIPL